MGGIATFDKKGSHFQRFGLKIFVIAAKVAKVQKLGVRDGLLGVVRVGAGKQVLKCRLRQTGVNYMRFFHEIDLIIIYLLFLPKRDGKHVGVEQQ